jgi:8-oxo-dGTP diphosphatase
LSTPPDYIICPACGASVKQYRNPLPTVDVIVSYRNGIVLIKRKNPPFGWAIPGGFIDYGESAEVAGVREIGEETGLVVDDLLLFDVKSDPDRDPRFHTITTIYTAVGTGILKAGDDASEAAVFNFCDFPDDIAFDHRDVLNKYFKTLSNSPND